jgi:hypothetical protein
LAVTCDPRYLGYLTLIVALEPSVERVARALDGGQNKYSYVTAGTSVGFGGEIVGLSSICTAWLCADGLMKPLGSVRVVRM